jgi:hypothetical protein
MTSSRWESAADRKLWASKTVMKAWFCAFTKAAILSSKPSRALAARRAGTSELTGDGLLLLVLLVVVPGG